ncbi:hypothetical protein ACVGOW_08470 [Pseudonocardia saturnea]
MGALTGVALGVAQAVALPAGVRRRWIWAVTTPVLWGLGWVALPFALAAGRSSGRPPRGR